MPDNRSQDSSSGEAAEESPSNGSPTERAQALKDEVHLELSLMEEVTKELAALSEDVGGGPASKREAAASGQFLASFYMGVENILKRVLRFHGREIDRTERWHVTLFQVFAEPKGEELPALFDEALARQLRPYRRFRHVVHHSYGIELSWKHMQQGVENAPQVFAAFRQRVEAYLESLP